ncbi:MAG: transposase [Actinobacteria bacterium]|nr:transposase [Actinomycetota bacterium]
MAKGDDNATRETVTQVREEVKRREKAIMQRLMAEERELFLDKNPEDRGNGFQGRTLLTSGGHIEDLRVPVCLAQGTDHEGGREILGFWIMGGSGASAHAWREIFRELKERGVERIDIVVSCDLSCILEASRSVFPGADHHLCVVHAVRGARTRVRRSDCAAVLQGLKAIYRAQDQEEAERALSAFADT